ncbi:hypothetical protein [Actinomadura rugatobispora]|uniref:Tetracyclin repressor-like C-terminal domain-containing protein n=1 Tax=Actinomadura rugatobispora TaxID=1994 RepID=A0ABW1AK27_9ACTN|nr:hypothetical protein GCM10010200_071690 [Actinomadura rugatobispora]
MVESIVGGKLPGGRHGLPRHVVRDDQRRRILAGVVAAAGPEAMRRQDALLRTLTGLLAAEMRRSGARSPDLAAELTVNALYGVVYARVETGRAAELPELVPALVPDPAGARGACS